MLSFIPRERSRRLTHVIMALLSIVACVVTYFLKPEESPVRIITIGTGYLSLFQIVFTLLWGTWQLLSRATLRRNPVNIMLRRDVGIWAGVNGVVHVILGLQVHMSGDIVRYFFERAYAGLTPLTNLFGFSNYTGGLATILLVLLLLISNDLSVTWLRGPVWKWVQRLNYVLIVLTLLHTFGYQVEVERPPIMIVIVVALTLVTMAAQLVGVVISVMRRPAKAEGKAAIDRGCLVAVGVTALVPFLLAACLAGLWVYGMSAGEATPTHQPAHATEPPPHVTEAPLHSTPPAHGTPAP